LGFYQLIFWLELAAKIGDEVINPCKKILLTDNSKREARRAFGFVKRVRSEKKQP